MERTGAEDELGDVRRLLGDEEFLRDCAERLSCPAAEVVQRLETALGEAAVGLALLADLALAGRRVLEVGAGVGIVSLALHRRGVEVVPLEPGRGGSGFGLNARLGLCLRERLGATDLQFLTLGSEQLQPRRHGQFDVIFSVNVLEHIPDLEAAVAALCGVLGPGGLMRHTCPNYVVPYEPHFGLPLVPLFPRLTGWAMPGVRRTELWQSLNFVTLGRMRRLFARRGMDCRFVRGTMHAAFARLDTDPTYRQRQGGQPAVAAARWLLRRLGLLRALAALPPGLATPMTFEVRRHAG